MSLIIFTVLALAINAYIIYLSCLNGSQSSQASQGVVEVSEEVVNTVRPGTVTLENYNAFATFIRGLPCWLSVVPSHKTPKKEAN